MKATLKPPILLAGCLLPVLLLLAVTNVSAQNLPELMYFKFNTATSGNVANESPTATRVSVNGTLNGATIGGTGQFGAALQGNGGTTASNSLNANWPLSLSGSWTISMWISGLTNTATSNYIFGGAGGSTFRAMTGTGLVSGGGNIKVRATGMTDVDLTGVFDATGTPVVVHIVYDNPGNVVRTYKNGVLLSTTSQSSSLSLTGTDFRVGGYSTSNGLPSASYLDEFRMYNRVLTATEIANTWNVDLNGCVSVSSMQITNIGQKMATLSWPAVTGSAGYEYAITTSPTPPTAGTPESGTSVALSGLTPGVTYYAHVRNKCAATNYSGWYTASFTTLICATVDTIGVSNVTDSSAQVIWKSIAAADNYEYILTQNPTPPVSSTGTMITNGTLLSLSPLQANTTYYLWIRSKCFSTDESDWNFTSFTTRAKCLPPNVKVDNVIPGQPQLSWDELPFAVGYEYALTKDVMPPPVGITIYTTQMSVNIPADGNGYYFHVRTKCYDIFTTSAWSTTVLQQPTSVDNIAQSNMLVSTYPNPVTDVLHLKLNGIKDTDGVMTLVDMAGKVIFETTIKSQEAEINMSGFSPGIYILKVASQGSTSIVRIVKQ